MVDPASQPSVPVPKTNRDPIQSLRPTPVFFVVGEREFEIPALPAADWLSVLMNPDRVVDDLFIELVPNGLELVMEVLDPFDAEDLATDIIEAASARHWWVATRLIDFLAASWDVMGAEAIFHGVNAQTLSLAAWLDAMLALTIPRLSKEHAPMFVARLEAPPMGESIPEEEMAMSEGQFLSMGE